MRTRSILACLSIVLVSVFIITTQTSSPVKVQARTYNPALDDTSPIGLSEDVSSPQAAYGDILTYTISLTNTTVITPLNLLVTDTLPSSLAVIPASLWASQGTPQYSSSAITWSDTLLPSTTISISFQAQAVRANTTITNSFLADAGDLGIYTGPTVSTDIAPVQSFLPIVFNNYCSGPTLDDFSNLASGWPIDDTTYWSYGYLNGEYRFYAKSAAYGVVTRGDMGDPAVEIDAHQASTVNGSYGIAFYIYPDWNSFWTFEIYPATQQYAMWEYFNGNWFQVGYHGTSSAIHPGQGTNHLKIVDIGPSFGATNTYDFYVNGTMLFEFGFGWGDPSFLQTLRLGLTATADAAGFDVRFDNYAVTPQGCPGNPTTTNLPQLGKSFNNLFEMPSIQLSIPQGRPLRLTRTQTPKSGLSH